MFCPKCGSKALDGATFCQKCGAKLIVDDTVQQTDISTPTQQTQPSTYNGSSDTPKKKKLGKLPIILGAVALVIVAIVIAANFDDLLKRGEQAQRDEEYIAAQKQSSDAKLSESYINEKAGISFDYPAGWVVLDSDNEFEIVELIDSKNNADSIASFKVSCSLDQNPLGVFTGDEASVRDAVNENATFIKFGDTLIGEAPAKGVTYQKSGLKGDDIVTNFWYVIGDDVYQITCSYSASTADAYEPIFDAIMASYTISAAGTSDENGAESLTKISARDFVGTYSYDASFETPDGQYTNFYYLLEIGEDGKDLVVTETWRGNDILDHVRVSPENLTGNTLVVKTNIEVYDKESYSLTYIPAKDSPSGKDTIYIDGDDTMPFVRE